MPIDALIDLFAAYLYALRLATALIGSALAILGTEDLLIDLIFWLRRLWRSGVVYSRHRIADEQVLYGPTEQPLAILVPAWQEVGVIGEMAQLAASRLDYENYQIFVGTYPNDPDTQADVDEACRRFSNVHKVVCALPGPTSKADCLNNVLEAVLDFEREASIRFRGFILHDAEDVISPLELRLFNLLVDRKDLIQVPVYPFLHRHWWNFTANHYADEFAELHGKDVLVREALVGQVPSAGVGTCFSRRALVHLLDEGEGIAFSTQSLTEDYDIGIRLRQAGMREIFVRFSPRDPALAPLRERRFGVSRREGKVICVRENFPDTLATAIRQKSRWITGIVFQGAQTLPWTRNWLLNYFLWRDRRGAISNLIGLLSMLLALQLGLVWLASVEHWSGWDFASVLGDSRFLHILLAYNGVLLLNRIVQRIIFTGSITQRPGEAVIYLERALAQGRSDGRSLLAFALAASGEPDRAYQLWSELPPLERHTSAVQAGMAQVALELERPEQAEAHWRELSMPDRDQWRLGGLIAQARGDLNEARLRFEHVLATSEDGADFYQAGLIARAQGDRVQARRWLQRATELSPGQGAYLSDYGFTLSQDPDRRIRDQAVPVLLEASRVNPSNPALEAELANRYREQGNRSASLQHLGRAIELEQDPSIATEPLDTPEQRQRIYGLKRSYESLARNDSWLFNLTVAPDGAAQTVNEALINANNNMVGTAIYEHRLPLDGLFGYGRLISANDALNNQNQTAGGLGLRYAPIRGVNMNLFTEAYQGQIGQANTSDLLLRINGSLLDQGHWNAEWKEDRRAWNERSLYLDAAWFVNQNQTLSLARYSQGRTWRLGQGWAQTLSPYVLGQFSQQNSQTDLRIGLGLRWQLWLQQDRLRAYRRKITARAELQQSLAGDLYRNGTGVVLSLQADL